MNDKVKNFKKELKELMNKYNVSIGFTCDDSSDTYGLFDDHIVIEMDNEVVIESDGWWLNKNEF